MSALGHCKADARIDSPLPPPALGSSTARVVSEGPVGAQLACVSASVSAPAP